MSRRATPRRPISATDVDGCIPTAAPLLARELDERQLSIPEVGERCGVSDKTVWRWIRAGKLVARKLGGQWRIHPADYRQFLHAGLR